MQDIAGLRVVTDGGREAQDQLVVRLIEALGSPQVDDRRLKPQHGYRAVHVIVSFESRWVEIQVRTLRQHQRAELFEKTGDLWGRGIRYGDPPDAPDKVVGLLTRANFIKNVQMLSDIISEFESLETDSQPRKILLKKLGSDIDTVLKSWMERVL